MLPLLNDPSKTLYERLDIIKHNIIQLNKQHNKNINTRRNLILFHPHMLQLLFDLIIFQLHLAILSLQVACCIN